MGFKDSILGALGVKAPEISKEVLLKLREAMLCELGKYDTTSFKSLFMKVHYADDIEMLWDLRIGLLPVLKEMHGEMNGVARMAAITELFVGHHPASKRRA